MQTRIQAKAKRTPGKWQRCAPDGKGLTPKRPSSRRNNSSPAMARFINEALTGNGFPDVAVTGAMARRVEDDFPVAASLLRRNGPMLRSNIVDGPSGRALDACDAFNESVLAELEGGDAAAIESALLSDQRRHDSDHRGEPDELDPNGAAPATRTARSARRDDAARKALAVFSALGDADRRRVRRACGDQSALAVIRALHLVLGLVVD